MCRVHVNISGIPDAYSLHRKTQEKFSWNSKIRSAMAFQGLLWKRTIAKAKSKFEACNRLSLCVAFGTVPSSYSTFAAATEISKPPQLPPFDYDPKPYQGPLADEVFAKRRKFLGPSLFHYYQKPVSVERKLFPFTLMLNANSQIFSQRFQFPSFTWMGEYLGIFVWIMYLYWPKLTLWSFWWNDEPIIDTRANKSEYCC